MANGFSITIGAVDNATSIVSRVNKSLATMQAPAKRFAAEVSKFSQLTGLNKVSQGFDRIVHTSLGAVRSVAQVAEPLAAITGAASIAGMTALITKWGDFQTQIGFAAQRMGILPQELGAIRASGALAGASADAMQSGFESLGQTLYDVANGASPQAAFVMSRLGIALTDATGHARRAKDIMPQLADAIARIRNPLAQGRLAAILFGGAADEMLPVLRLGSAGMADLNRQAQK